MARLTPSWAKFVIGSRKEVVVALDWTDFEKDDHTTLCAYVVTTHGPAAPLTWKTVRKSTLAGRRKGVEYIAVLLRNRSTCFTPYRGFVRGTSA